MTITASNSERRHMAKRKPKELYVLREGSGRPSRAAADAMQFSTPVQVKRLRDAALLGMADEHWGWEIGRLFLQGKIAADQFEAGKRWRRLVWAWRQAWGIPPSTTKTLSLFAEPKSPSADPDSERGKAQVERARALHEELRIAHGALEAFGHETVKSVRYIVEDDCVPIGQEDFERLDRGLRILSSYWGLTARG